MKLSLNLLDYAERLPISVEKGQKWVFDFIRKKNIVLLPEEMVRQCLMYYLVEEAGISKNLIRVEKGIKVNGLYRRCDVIIYDRNALPLMIIEIKKPSIKLDQGVFNQIAMYNIPLRVPYLMVSNGIETYLCSINLEEKTYDFMSAFPGAEKLFGKS